MQRLCLGAVLFFSILRFIHAHPLDITYTSLQSVGGGMFASTYIHPYEVALLARSRGLGLAEESSSALRELIFSYLDERIDVMSTNKSAVMSGPTYSSTRLSDILAEGLTIDYFVTVDEYPVTIVTDMFTEYSNTQTNKIVFLDMDENMYPGSSEVLLTNRRTEFVFDIETPDFSSEIDDYTDTDGDGLSDHYERLYGLDLTNTDTDEDGFSDFIEISFGWDPFDKTPGEDQTQAFVQERTLGEPESDTIVEEGTARDASDKPIAERGKNLISERESETEPVSRARDSGHIARNSTGSALTENPRAVTTRPLIVSRRGDGFLKRTLEMLELTMDSESGLRGIMPLMLAVFALGFLHASLPGHGNAVLASFMTAEDRKFRQALAYIATFVVTHLVYVAILAVGLTVFTASLATDRVARALRIVGGFGMVAVSGFMIYRGIKAIRSPATSHRHDHRHRDERDGKSRSAVLLGFLSGLVPCSYGWALLMMILTIGRVSIVPAVVIPFGLGISTFLILLAAAAVLVRNTFIGFFAKTQRYSHLASGILLLTFSVVFLAFRSPMI